MGIVKKGKPSLFDDKMQSRKYFFIFNEIQQYLNEVYNIYRQPMLMVDYFLARNRS